MNSARYVGRVGALAVALGVGAAIASGGVAHASPTDPGPSNTTIKAPDSTSSDTATHALHQPKPLRALIQSIVKLHAETAQTPQTGANAATDNAAAPAPQLGDNQGESIRKLIVSTKSTVPQHVSIASVISQRPIHTVFATVQHGVDAVANAPGAAAPTVPGTGFTAAPAAKVQPLSAVKSVEAITPTPALTPVTTPSPIRSVLSFLTSIGLTPQAFPAGSPLAPIGQLLTLAYTALRRVDDVAFNQAPTGFSTSAPAAPDPKTGVVTGTLAIDPDGDTLNYTVTQAPKYGTLAIEQATPGTLTYTYTPDYTKSTTGNETDEAFTVDVNDDSTFHLNPGDTTVTVSNIDVLPNNTVVKTIDTGFTPTGIAINKAANRVYVVGAGKLEAIDADPNSATYNTIIQTVDVSGSQERVASVVRPDGKEYVYVIGTAAATAPDGGARLDDVVTAYENVDGTLVARPSIDLTPNLDDGTITQDITGSADGSKVYVTGQDGVFVVDTATNTVITKLPLPDSLNSVAAGNTANGPAAYVSNYEGEVHVVNGTTNAAEPTIPIGDPNDVFDNFTSDIVLSPDGRYAYVSDEGIFVIDTTTNTVVNYLQSGDGGVNDSRGLAISADGKRLYVNRINADQVDVIDTSTGDIIGTTAVDDTSEVVVTPDGTRAYVYAFAAPTVSVIDYEVPAQQM